jgi:hypothetical protein
MKIYHDEIIIFLNIVYLSLLMMPNNFPSMNIVFFYFQNYGPHDVA